jgi:dihydroflavonol-4-reductase
MLDAASTRVELKSRVNKKGQLTGRILVSGATGFLGRYILTSLHKNEACESLALVRNMANWHGQEWTKQLDNVELVSGSVTRPDAWFDDKRLDGMSGILHLAAVVRHSRNEPYDIYQTNVEGTLNMVRLAARKKCRMVFVSTSGTVGCFKSKNAWADENSAYCEDEVRDWPYYHSKILAERQARQLAVDLGVELVIIRPPVMLGPGDHRFRSTGHIIKHLLRKLPFLLHGGIHFIDIRDATDAILAAMRHKSPRPIYHLSGTACGVVDFFDMIESVSGVPRPGPVLPFQPAWVLALIDERVGIITKGEALHFLPDPVVVEMASHYWDVRSLWAEDELGYQPRNGMDTLRDTVAWLREHHDGVRAAIGRS